MRFDKNYLKSVKTELQKAAENKDGNAEFSIDAPEGFATVPPIEECRLFDNLDDFAFQERLTRFAIQGKRISVLLDGKDEGSFVMSSTTDRWDVFPVFVKHPRALLFLIETVTAYLIKKSLPLPKNTKP